MRKICKEEYYLYMLENNFSLDKYNKLFSEYEFNEELLNEICSHDLENETWSIICKYQNITNEFIQTHIKNVNWISLILNKNYNSKDIIKYKEYISLNDLNNYMQLLIIRDVFMRKSAAYAFANKNVRKIANAISYLKNSLQECK